MDDRALMQMALDALKVVNDVGVSANWHRHFDNQIKALQQGVAADQAMTIAMMDRERVRTTVVYNQFMTAGEYAKAVQKATEDELKEKNACFR